MNRREYFILALVFFLSVAAWVAFDVYRAKTTQTVSQKELRQVVPLTPVFDNDIINKLKTREE